MGSGKGTQTQQQSYVASPQIQAAGTQALNQAQSAAQLPFNLPVAPVAGFNPQQQQAFQQYGQLQGMAQPYFNQAQGLFNQSAAPISASQINQYLNPYAGNVLAQLQSQQGAQMADLTGKATQTAGGVGADRIGVAQGQLANQQSLATGQTLAGIYGSALGAAQQDAQRQQSAAYGIGNLGGAAQNAAIQGTNALYGSGAYQQQLNQAQLNAPYQNQLAQAAFPYQQAQYLAGVTGNLAGAFGGTTYGQMTPAQPSMFSQVAGLGTGLAGAYGAYNSLYGSGGSNIGPTSVGGAPLAKDGGRIGYDNGGGVTGDAGWMNADPAIPVMQMHPAQANHPQLNWNTGKSDNIGSDIGNIAGAAAKIAPLFMLNRGGSVYSNKFADGGDSFDDRFDPVYSNDPTRDANFAAGADMLRQGKGQVWGNPTSTRSVAPDVVNAGDPIRMDASGKMMGNITSNRGQAPVANTLDGPPSTKLVVNPMAGPPDDAAPAPAYVPLSSTKSAAPLAALHQSADDEAGSSPYGGSTSARDAAAANMASMKDRTYATPYPDVGYGQQSTSRDFARSPWLALMNAGFGMMAGTSPYAGVNIGKGLLAGTQTLEKQREQDREDESVNQRAKQLAMQADQHLDTMTKMTPVDAARVQQAQNALEQKGWQKGNENAMGDITLWRSTPDGIESGVLHADGRFEARGVAAPSGGLSMDASKPPQTAPIPPIPVPPGSQAPPPQSAPAPANTAIAPSGSQIVNTPPEQMIAPAQESGAETNPAMLAGYNSKGAAQYGRAATGQERKDIVKATQAADKSQYRLQDMKRDLDTVMSFVNGAGNGSQFLREAMRPGVGSDKIVEAAKIYNKMNPGHGVPQEVLSAAVNWSKNATLAGFSGIVGEGLSAREAQPIIRASMGAVASMNLPEAASRALISGGMQLAQRAKDKQAFFDDYVAHNGGISNGWEAQFEKKHPIGNYIARSVVDSLPPEGRAKLGADAQLLRQRRDEFMKVEKAGGAGAVEARQKYERVKRNFDFRYGGTSNYFAFGSL